jgi:hypothetical protein
LNGSWSYETITKPLQAISEARRAVATATEAYDTAQALFLTSEKAVWAAKQSIKLAATRLATKEARGKATKVAKKRLDKAILKEDAAQEEKEAARTTVATMRAQLREAHAVLDAAEMAFAAAGFPSWWDGNHPGPARVVELVTNWLTQTGLPRGSRVYLVGDSTTAYSVDRCEAVTWYDLAHQVEEATGISVYFSSVSGSSFDTRWGNIVYKASRVESFTEQFDAVLLVGGWNQGSCYGLDARLAAFNAACRQFLP